MKTNKALTHERLTSLLAYDPNNGIFTWKVYRGRKAKAGDMAGRVGPDRYRRIVVDGSIYLAHRLAWLHVHGMWPADKIDHINMQRCDNRIANLREASQSQNKSNGKCYSSNRSGMKGVTLHGTRYAARICKDGINHHLGTFATPEQAHEAYCKAANELFGEFARAA